MNGVPLTATQDLLTLIIETWSSLLHDIVNANSVNAFKNRLDKYCANEELQLNYRATLNTRRTGSVNKYLLIL